MQQLLARKGIFKEELPYKHFNRVFISLGSKPLPMKGNGLIFEIWKSDNILEGLD